MSLGAMASKSTVLVVDDETALRRTLRIALTAVGFCVQEAGCGEEAVEAVKKDRFDLVLLDVNMPGMCGFQACQSIRGIHPQAGILMVSVRNLEEDKIRALEAGADDYITKPFHVGELKARLRAVLRRTGTEKAKETAVLEVGRLKLDLERRHLWKGEEQLHLSPTEFDLLALLMKNPGATLTHIKLLRTVWGVEYGGELEYLRSYVRMLRRKIEDDPARPEYILTEPWVGYRFRDPSNPSLQTDAENAGDRAEILAGFED